MYKTTKLYIQQCQFFLKTLWFRSANVSTETPASDERVRQFGLIYSVYRFVVGTFLLLVSYSVAKAQIDTLPSFSEAVIISAYLLVSLFLLLLFYVLNHYPRRQLLLGFFVDVIFLTAYSLHGSISDLQIALLYMIIVSASFVLLLLSRAVVVMVFTIIAILYQQFAHTFAVNHTQLTLSDSILLCFCLVAVGFVSWSIFQRLAIAEKLLLDEATKVEKLNTVNEAVVRNMVNGILVLDQNRDIVIINEPAQKLLRLPTDAQACSTPAKMLELARTIVKEHPDLIHWYRAIDANIATSFVYDLKPSIDNPSDKLRINSKPLTNYGQMLVIEDISREQSQAQTLKLASLGGLSASIAHEIRNPLGSISQAIQLLLESTNLDEEDMEFCQIIDANAQRVNNIIESILSLSRQEKPNQEPIKIYYWLKDFITQHYAKESIFINLPDQDENINIYFDHNHLEQIMVNLVNNALHHTVKLPEQADVELKLTANNDNVFIDIIDNGQGISEESISRLFHPFFTTSKKGTGLGLYLSQSFSEANNAKIRYLNHARSCFRLITPRLLPTPESDLL
ncbi:MAG: ATP-binding protein [Moraxella sp.]|nr:ATP-binding protein [Moraxella sp.]